MVAHLATEMVDVQFLITLLYVLMNLQWWEKIIYMLRIIFMLKILMNGLTTLQYIFKSV